MVIVAVFALLALFSIISIVHGHRGPERSTDLGRCRENPLPLDELGRR